MRRAAVLVLLLAAIGGWAGFVAPARRERDRARAEYARSRQERERLRHEVSGEERGRRAVAPGDAAAAGRALRSALLRATEGLDLEAVEIAAAGERGGASARGTLSVRGEIATLLRLTERLVEPAGGVRVERVTLGPAAGGPAFDGTTRLVLEGTSVESGS